MPNVAVRHKDFPQSVRRSASGIDRMKTWQQRNQNNHFSRKAQGQRATSLVHQEMVVLVLERRTAKVGPPQMYQVVMLNDDYTPMEFVVLVLQEFFNKDREAATQIMLKIHLDGKGVCGVFTRDVAATKVDQVLDAANQAGHPLQCVSEPVA